ncbi:hypothetical protein [Undibacterium sp. SXout20W]|uniref:hypothetical protein n=1 Tax=Undibacterium sp. SXout20W TaxID=3413051 RepID=UPI003BF3524D
MTYQLFRRTLPMVASSMLTKVRCTSLLLCGLFFALPNSSNASADSVKLYYENRAPFMQVLNGELFGSEGLPASTALKAAGIPFTLSEAPVARQLFAIYNNTEPACAIGLYWTSEREKAGKYTQAIALSSPQSAVVRVDNPKTNRIESLAELLGNQSLTLILRNVYSYGDNVDAMLKKANAHILRPAESSYGRVKLVLIGSVDAALFSHDEAEYQIKQFGEQGKKLVIKRFRDVPEGKPRYLYCSKMVDDETIKKINDALKSSVVARNP